MWKACGKSQFRWSEVVNADLRKKDIQITIASDRS